MKHNSVKYYALSSFMAVLTGIMAQVCFYIGPIPYTMQNYAIVLTALILKPKYATISQLTYLALIALGLPLAANMKGGIIVLMGPTAGYLWSFPLVVYLISKIVKPIADEGKYIKAWIICNLISTITYIIGTLWLYLWISIFNGVIRSWIMIISNYLKIHTSPILSIFFIGTIIFIPQDFLIDHLLAILTYKEIHRLKIN